MLRTKALRFILSMVTCLLTLGQTVPAFADELPPLPPNDALIPPMDVQRMRANSILDSGTADSPAYFDTSVYAIGTVAVGLILPESNGTVDANTEDWTIEEAAKVKSEIQEALTWWESQAPAAANLHFVLDQSAPLIVPTSFEPINHPQTDEGLWIGETLGNIGYGSGGYFERAYAYVNALRDQYDTDWAFAIFVADSSVDPDGYFKDYTYAYAYLGGPFIVMTYDNASWRIGKMGQVAAHEIGHIFLAGDQYKGGGCSTSQAYGYLAVPHSWCNSGNASIMNGDYTLDLADPARGQVGWRDSDSDGIPDPIDAEPTVTLPPHSPNPTTELNFSYSGTVESNPYPHGTCLSGYCWSKDVNITKVSAVEVQVGGGDWQPIPAADGTYDEEIEEFNFPVGSLSPGTYTIQVNGTSAFSRNGSIPATVTAPASDTVTIEESMPPGIYDDKDILWTYTGAWKNANNKNASNGSFHYTAKIGNEASFTFYGAKFSLIYTAGNIYGNVGVFVDGVKISTLRQYNAKTKYQQTYTSPTLTNTTHTVRFVHQTGKHINVDAIRTYGPPDLDPPAAITDLLASRGPSNGSVNLTWSAPAEDSTTGLGAASSYQVRYSLHLIDANNWDSAMVVTSGLPTPGAPGESQQMTVSGLVPGLTYYFAIRAQDDEPNLGGMSNSPVSVMAMSPAPMGTGKYDDKHASWNYFGTWNNLNNTRAFGKSVKYSTVAGNSTSFVFTGTNFILGYLNNSGYGILDVYVDGVRVASINQSGKIATMTFTLSYPLTVGQHTVQLVHKSGSRIDVDAIRILP